MKEPIAVSPRAAARVRGLVEQGERIQSALQATVEVLGAQLDVPPGWRFDMQTMAFVPPTTPAAAGQGESTPPNG